MHPVSGICWHTERPSQLKALALKAVGHVAAIA